MDIATLSRVSVAAAFLASGCRTAPDFGPPSRGRIAHQVISAWPETSRAAAALAIVRYGPPDAIAQDALGWTRAGPWLRVVVVNASAGAGTRSAPELEETVAYRFPASKRDALARFGRGVTVADDGAALSSKSGDENLNFLALNLADEIARGARDPADARRTYDRIATLAVAGKSSPYTRGLLFPAQ